MPLLKSEGSYYVTEETARRGEGGCLWMAPTPNARHSREGSTVRNIFEGLQVGLAPGMCGPAWYGNSKSQRRCNEATPLKLVIPAEAGIQVLSASAWIPAFAGMTAFYRFPFVRIRTSHRVIPMPLLKSEGSYYVTEETARRGEGGCLWMAPTPNAARHSREGSTVRNIFEGLQVGLAPAGMCGPAWYGNSKSQQRCNEATPVKLVIPAEAGIQVLSASAWIPAFAGMTVFCRFPFVRIRTSHRVIPMPLLKSEGSHYVTVEMARLAVSIVTPLIESSRLDPRVVGSGFFYLVVMDPALTPSNALFEDAILYEQGFGDEAAWDADYRAFALDKARISWTHGMDAHALQTAYPYRLRPGDSLLWGSVYLDGIVVGASGAFPWFDEMLAGSVALAIRALAKEARQGELPGRVRVE